MDLIHAHAAALAGDPAQQVRDCSTAQVRGQPTALVSRLTATSPTEVSKVFSLDAGQLRTSTSANIGKGVVETVACRDLEDFAEILMALRSSQCLMYGVPELSPVDLVTEAFLERTARPQGAISRTEKNLRWNAGAPGILMLDHDPQPGLGPYEPSDLVKLLREAVPTLADVDMLTWPSASSLIFNRRTDEQLRALRGCRVYLMVADAASIPQWGNFIVDSMWAAGHGVCRVSRSGRVLERGLFDTLVWQASRIDFAAGAICREPLEQRRGKPVLHRGLERFLGHRASVPSLTPERQAAARQAKAVARQAVETEASAARATYAKEKRGALEQLAITIGRQPEVARARAQAAVDAMLRREAPELHGDVTVSVVRKDGRIEELTINEILRRKREFDHAKTLDPLEPEYDGARAVGMLFLKGPVPRLFSFARGETTYKLVAKFGDVQLASGALHQSVDQTIQLLRSVGDVYDHGDALATVSADGRLIAINQGLLPYMLSARINFFRPKLDPRTGEFKRWEEDPPAAVCKAVYELGSQRQLASLNGVITTPIIVGNRVLQESGYDADSGLLLVLPDGSRKLDQTTSLDQAKSAFLRLVDRFNTFPFDTPADRGVFLAALFTAVMRPGLRTAPGFAFDAPAQGTGKSLLTDCVAIVRTGEAPSALPHLHDDEAEVRKRLVSLLYEGSPVMIWDNIKGTFDSAVLASLLTAAQFNDRLLGETKLLSLPNRMLMLFNGNNMTLRGELTRRILTCRLDSRQERPYLRRFESCPRQLCVLERQEIVHDVLTVIKGHIDHCDVSETAATLGSFEEWSSAVLRPLLWIAAVCEEAQVGDPMAKLETCEEDDDDLQALAELHRAWHARYGETPKTLREVIKDISRTEFSDMDDSDSEGDGRIALDEAISAFLGDGVGRYNLIEKAKALGKQLGYRKDRVVEGRRLFKRLSKLASGGVAKWSARIAEPKRSK